MKKFETINARNIIVPARVVLHLVRCRCLALCAAAAAAHRVVAVVVVVGVRVVRIERAKPQSDANEVGHVRGGLGRTAQQNRLEGLCGVGAFWRLMRLGNNVE
jgi:hypothetical protein